MYPKRKSKKKGISSKMLNERSLLSQFLHFVAATVASLMVFSLYSIVDGLMVAKGVGEYAMAAVNLAVPFTNVLFSIGVIFAVGASTIIAIYLGQGQGEKANSLFSQNIVLLTCIGLVISVLVFVFLEPFAVLLGAKGVTYQYTIDYLRGLAPFALCFIVSYNMEVLIKTDGYPRIAILTVITGCLTNCVLDYVAIFLLDWGVWGAAFATGLSQLLTCVIYLRHFVGGHNTFHFVKFRMDWSIYKRLIPLGFADGVTELCNGVMIFLFNRVILRCLGDDGLVCYTIIAYVNTLIINTMLGISQGSQPLVSYHYGMHYGQNPEFKYSCLILPMMQETKEVESGSSTSTQTTVWNQAKAGEPFTVYALLRNTGSDGITTVQAKANSEVMAEKIMTVPGGSWRVVQMDITLDAGEYTIEIGGQTGTIIIE